MEKTCMRQRPMGLSSSFIHVDNIVTALGPIERFLCYVASECNPLVPISAHGCHFLAIFSAAPVLCESPRPSGPPALALD